MELYKQFRLYLTEVFLSWALSIVPKDTDEALELADMLKEYCKNRLK